ncbi:MAG: hypothetical protein ACRDJH_27455 [Thermomicrobiales bacterium]
MADIFELMDLTTANVIGHFDSEDEALAIVRDVVTEEGIQAVDELALSYKPGGKLPRFIATGAELADRALAHSVSRSR